jgi:hypothetical protein
MDAKILGLCTTAIIVAATGAISSSRSIAATRSEEGVYERYQRYSKAPANDFWYYHPGGPFYLYAPRHYAYLGRHAHHRASWHGRWRRQYAWRGHYGWGWTAHGGYGRWGGAPVDGRCWSGEPSVWGWHEIRVC